MIYIASKTRHAPKWKALRSAGWPIISTWIDEAEEAASKDLTDLWVRCVDEASKIDCLIIYTERGDTILRGAYLEMGCALGNGKPVITVGFDRDVFSALHHPLVSEADTIEAALEKAKVFLGMCTHDKQEKGNYVYRLL